MIKGKQVSVITVEDPDTKLPVEVVIIKLATGGMMGVDASYVEQEVGPIYSPFDEGHGVDLDEDEDEEE